MLQVTKNEFQQGRGTFDVIRFEGRVIAEKHNGALHCNAVSREMAAEMIRSGLEIDHLDGVPFLQWAMARHIIETHGAA